MDKSLSDESKDLLRDMKNTEAWRLYESLQKEEIQQLRALASSQTAIEERVHYYDIAQGREDALTSLTTTLYDSRTK